MQCELHRCLLLPAGRALQGPGNFLRERQKANAGEFILSPIRVAMRRRLDLLPPSCSGHMLCSL